MAHFTAQNIEPDDQSDDEVDNTKELQIEDALKLYQNALKLHAQGHFPQAADAYTNLFKSEVFSYPESITEFARLQINPELELVDPLLALDLELAAAAAADEAPSTLPQLLYSAYKNHGQFILDCVKSRLKHEYMDKATLDYQAKSAVDNFALALANDESDAQLWRRAARIGLLLGSKRISRYCLEAAVELDDDPTLGEVEPPSLEEAFAGEQLKGLLQGLSDGTSLSHPIMDPFIKKSIPKYLTKHMDPYPFLRQAEDAIKMYPDIDGRLVSGPTRNILHVQSRTWNSIGETLCDAFIAPDGLSGKSIVLVLPSGVVQSTELDIPSSNTAEDQLMNDVMASESPAAETREPASGTPVLSTADDVPVHIVTTTTTIPISDGPRRGSGANVPTRKRSQSAAGVRETPEDDSATQKRSKRIKNRDTSDIAVDPSTQITEQLQNFARADEDVFKFVGNLLKKLDVSDLGTFSELQAVLAKDTFDNHQDAIENTAVKDLRDLLQTWDDPKASTFINASASDTLGSSVGSANAGLSAFLEHAKSGPAKISTIPSFSDTHHLSEFVAKIESGWFPLQDIIYEWVIDVLQTYRTSVWPEALKVTVVRTISFADAELYERFRQEVHHAREIRDATALAKFDCVIQTLFELHLDIYSRITNPSSIVSYETRTMTKDRLGRWADFSSECLRMTYDSVQTELTLRFLWASVFYAAMSDTAEREHKVLLWTELKIQIRAAGINTIELQNNAVMPEISIAAAEREVSRLTTMDFFNNLFQTENSDPVAIIYTLEPVLDPESACEPGELAGQDPNPSAMENTLRDMWKFLETGSTSLRLFLWQRLREAYLAIGYNTKVFSCHLKCIEIIAADLRSEDYVQSADEPRRYKLLIWLKALDDLLVKSLTIALNDAATCFDIVDERHLRSTCKAIAQLNRVLHTAALFDDETRAGSRVLPTTGVHAPGGSFSNFITKLREMQVRTWALQYTMAKEAMLQWRELFTHPNNDLADFLALVHYTLGIRMCCKASNKIFLKMMKVEMTRLKHLDRWEDYVGQVLYDLYGLRLGVGTYLLEEHGCPTENVDRRTVITIADKIISLANKMPIKELLKHELRTTIEKMQTAVGPTKQTNQMTHNLRNYTEFLKTSLRPIDFLKGWKGQMLVDSVPVVSQDTALADLGWFFLLGMIAFSKFKSVKRLTAGTPIDDLKVGASFFRLQLQFSADHWETWFRLAQCFDCELNEEVMWSADKVNNSRVDLIMLQRSAIHCYVMALSTAIRGADDSPETAEKLSEMYFEFGMRIYASTRDPFRMEAFYVDGFERHFSGSQGMYKKPLHDEMTRYKAWSHAAKLFRRSLSGKDRPNKWMSYYMLGKCLWKMYCKPSSEWDAISEANKPKLDNVIDVFVQAIKTCPKPRDSRQEPILEPHYKLVSVVHKCVLLRAMEPQPAAELLQAQPYGVNKRDEATLKDYDDWEPFILSQIRHLRNADKHNWQHRMVARVVNIIYDEEMPDYAKATAARIEFRESIFTKTMQINVWKPDFEREGRHCVYMERYTRLMIKILGITNDKAGIEALAKRIRKKSIDFYKFELVWSECCTMYLRLLRRSADIPSGIDEVFRGIAMEEWERFTDSLSDWIADQTNVHPALDVLRETIELKKINANLMKATPIDDLINEAWATLYIHVGKTLPVPPPSQVIPQVDGEASTPQSRGMGPMALTNLVMDMNGTQIQVPVTIAATDQNRPRKIGISRREVLRRAEMAINRTPEPSRAAASSSSRQKLDGPPPSLILGSNAPPSRKNTKSRSGSAAVTSNSTPQPTEPEDKDMEQELDLQGEEDGERDDDKEEENSEEDPEGLDEEELENQGEGDNEEESERGSVHDSADDESDLSDLPEMEDVDEASVFPDLAAINHS